MQNGDKLFLVGRNLMRQSKLAAISLFSLCLSGCQLWSNPMEKQPQTIKVATFNVSMEANNYVKKGEDKPLDRALIEALASGSHQQIKNIAEIIQRTNADIILLNEFDYIADPAKGINTFKVKYLEQSQNGQTAIDYPYVYLAPVNTGVSVPEAARSKRLTHFGFGRYPGQYGMVVLSRFPIATSKVRTFQNFLWQDMPNHLMPVEKDGSAWYPEHSAKQMRLSSKSHWDLPINVCGNDIHLLASHPTPPVFDGEEDRNGRRNHDEIRFWADYINADVNSYHYDDSGSTGGLKTHDSDSAMFVIAGDLNANDIEGDAYPGAMSQLLEHNKINNYSAPTSKGGAENKPDNPNAPAHTAYWGMRADYVVPSASLTVVDSGVFWPERSDEAFRLVKDRSASSDHRLVWAELALPKTAESCKTQN